MPRRPRTRVRLLVEATKCGVVGVLAIMATGVGATVHTQDVTAQQDLGTQAPGQARLDRLMAKHECSRTGFDADVIPGSALVLRDNRVRHVSFDAGWAVYTGDADGTLLAVCKVDL